MKRNRFWSVFALAWVTAVSSALADAQTLREAVEQAVWTNPEVLATANHRLAADEGLKQARGGYWPRVDLSAGTGRERVDSVDSRALGLSGATFGRRDAGITVSQMLYDGFAVKSEVARQQARVDSSAYSVAATAEDIALRTVGVYLEVLRRQETVAAAIDNLDAHQRIYDHIKIRSTSGVGRRADQDQAEGRLALAKTNVRTEQSSLKDAEVAYFRLVGTQPRALTRPVAPDNELPRTEGLAMDTALVSHPALKAAEADVAAAKAQHSAAKAALSPRVDLELGASHDRDGLHGVTDDRSIMLRLRYNFSRGGSDLALISQTRFQILESDEALNRSRRQVAESLALAYNANFTARDQLNVLKQYVDSSAATRESYAKQFSIGQRTLLDLLNAENEYFSARFSYITGQYAELASMFRIYAGMGQLLNTLQIAMPVEAARVRGVQ